MSSDKLAYLHRLLLSSSCKDFTCGMFKYMNKSNYIVGRHHDLIFKALDKVVRGETRKLIINIAPRYGKTLLCSQMFIAYGLAINPEAKFLHLSYSGFLTEENSMAVKDIINNEYFQAVFPTRYSAGNRSKWYTEQKGGVYATSTLGQITGFGAGRLERDDEEESMDKFTAVFNPDKFSGAIVIDDPIKPEDALSDTMREQVNRRFETTIRNRVNSRKTPIIVIMQRLHERDLCGYLQMIEPGEWEVLSIPCIDTDGNALWEHKHTLEELYKIKDASPFVFETQYMQNPKPMEGLMYRDFKTYDTIPFHKQAVRLNYTDTADEGSDYFCSVCYEEHPDALYVTDVIYTKKTMEFTEPELTKMLIRENTQICMIESNNGGRIFSRNVERMSRERGNPKTVFKTFAQTKNKQQRIFTYSNEVCNMIVFPKNWEALWPEFSIAIKAFRKEGRNKNDDAPDTLTGMIEKRGTNRITVTDSQILQNLL